MPIEPLIFGQASFAAGELSPDLYARVDFAKYHVGARTLRNMFVHKQGGASNRPGTEFVDYAEGRGRLIPFQFNAEQAYVLEFTEGKMRVIKDGGVVLNPLVSAGRYSWTASGSGTNEYYVRTDTGTDPFLLPPNNVYEDGTAMTGGTLGSLAAGEYQYGDNDSLGYDTVYVRLTDNTDPQSKDDAYVETEAQIVSPYNYGVLSEITFTQSSDTMFMAHYAFLPQTLTREDHFDWTFDSVSFSPTVSAPSGLAAAYSGTPGSTTLDMKYKVATVNADGDESEPSVEEAETVTSPWDSGEFVTLTWSKVTGAKRYNVYKNRNGYYGFIGTAEQVAGGTITFIDDNIAPDLSDGPRSTVDPFGPTYARPGVVGIFQQRVFYGRTSRKPQTIWGTDSGTLNVMTRADPIKDSDAIIATLLTGQVNGIRHFVPLAEEMLVFTSGAEWTMRHGDNTDVLAPLSLKFRLESSNGIGNAPPLQVDQRVLYADRVGRVVRDIGYSLEVNGMQSSDRSILSSHFFSDASVKEWAFQKSPDSIIWCVLTSGDLLSFTYLPEHQVWAWAKHTTSGRYESVAAIPGDGYDEVYFIVRRKLNGQYRRTIERLVDRRFTDVEDCFFVDCGLSLDSPVTINGVLRADPAVVTAVAHGFSDGDQVRIDKAEGMTEINKNNYLVANKTTDTFELTDLDGNDIDARDFGLYESGGEVRLMVSTVSGLDHLEGEAVSVLADGSVVEGKVVSGGAITLPRKAAKVHVGLPYESYLETLDVESQSEQSVQSRKKRIGNATVRFKDSVGAKVGPTLSKLTTIDFRTTEDVTVPTQLYTGDHRVLCQADWNRSGRVVVKQDQPLPITVLGLMPELVFGDK